jgi:hypothetical protein
MMNIHMTQYYILTTQSTRSLDKCLSSRPGLYCIGFFNHQPLCYILAMVGGYVRPKLLGKIHFDHLSIG